MTSYQDLSIAEDDYVDQPHEDKEADPPLSPCSRHPLTEHDLIGFELVSQEDSSVHTRSKKGSLESMSSRTKHSGARNFQKSAALSGHAYGTPPLT